MLSELKNSVSNRQKVETWLDKIQEFDKSTRDEVIAQCKSDPAARKYYIQRFNDDCK